MATNKPPELSASDAPPTVGERIRWAMDRKQIGFNELDEFAGFSQGTTSSLLSGRRGKEPSAATIVAIAKALGVTAEWIMTGEEPRFPREHSSGEMVAVFGETKSDKPNLERAIDTFAKKRRWSRQAIIAARANDVDLPLDKWPDEMDRLHDALVAWQERTSRPS